MPSRFKLSQDTENTGQSILTESREVKTTEHHADAYLTKRVDVSSNSDDKVELHLYFANQQTPSTSKIYVKFRTSIQDDPTMNTMADWAYIQIDRLHPTTGEAEVLDLKYTIDTTDNNVKRYVLNVPAVGKWISAVVWADVATGANNQVRFDWMRSS